MKNIVLVSYVLMVFASIFDPIGSLWNARLITLFVFLGVLTVCIAFKKTTREINRLHLVMLLFLFFIVIYGFMISNLRGGLNGSFLDTSYASSFVYALTSLVYIIYRGSPLDVLRGALFPLRFLTFSIILTFAFSYFGYYNIIHFLVENGVMFFGSRDYGQVNFPYIYYIASPMIIALLCYEFSKPFSGQSVIWIALSSFALVLSGTRVNIISAFAIALFFVSKRSTYLKYLVYLCIFAGSVFFIGDVAVDFFSPFESSNAKKIGYLQVYSRIFSSIDFLLFGQGFNAHVWFHELSNILAVGASKTELTFLEFIRVFGILLFVAFGLILATLYVSLRPNKFETDWRRPTMIFYGVACALNPYLFSSNGMITLSIIFSGLYVNTLASRILSPSNEMKDPVDENQSAEIAFLSVLYKPSQNAIQNIRQAVEGGFTPIVYLNSVDYECLEELKRLDVVLLGENINVGLGKAFSDSEDYLKAKNFKYYIYFDQDTKVENALWKNVCANVNNLFLDRNVGMVFFSENPKSRSDLVISSGCLFSLEIIKKVGNHDKSFFVESVDYEFCLRLNIFGYKISTVFFSGIDHQSLQDCSQVNFFGRQLKFRVYGNSRLYDFNKSHIKIMLKSLRSKKYKYAIYFARSLFAFNCGEIKSRLLSRVK